MYHQYQIMVNATAGAVSGSPSTPSTTMNQTATSTATSQPGIHNGIWYPGESSLTDIHMGVALSAMIFYGTILIVALFFLIVRDRCRLFKNPWWINIMMVCSCRIVSSAFTFNETLNSKNDKLYQHRMYGASLGDDILCLVAFYILHLSFVERLCHVVEKWSLLAICFWLMISHLLAEPFLIVATVNTMKGREPAVNESETKSAAGPQPQIHKEVLLVGLSIGLYCFVVQSLFAVLAIKKAKQVSKRMRLFEVGVFLMIPLILSRVVSVLFMFWAPTLGGSSSSNGHEYTDHNVRGANGKLTYHRLYLEIIPEILTMLLALILAFLAPTGLPEMPCSEELESDIQYPEVDCLPQAGAPGMAFTPLKLNSTNILMQWYNYHLTNPFPTTDEKLDLVLRTGFTIDMIENWFEDTRKCTRMQHIEEEEHAQREPTLINNTDGVNDTYETRPVLFKTILIPPPIMLRPLPHGRIMTPPSGVVTLRMPILGPDSEKPAKASSWTVTPQVMKWALRSFRDINSVVTAESGIEVGPGSCHSFREIANDKVTGEGAWVQPRALSHRVNFTTETSKASTQDCVRSIVIQRQCAPPRIVIEDWEIVIPKRGNSFTFERIQELTNESSEEARLFD